MKKSTFKIGSIMFFVFSFVVFSDTVSAAYFNDFESGQMTGLTTGGSGGGTWSVTEFENSNLLYLSGDPDAGPNSQLGAYCLFEDTSYGNFTMTGRFKSSEVFSGAPNEWHDLAVIFGYTDDTHYYYASFNYFSDANSNGIMRINGDAVTKLSSERAGVLENGNWGSFKVKRENGSIEVYRNNELVFSADDSTYLQGKIGVGSFNDNVMFDDIYILPQGEKELNLSPHLNMVGNRTTNVRQLIEFSIKATDPNEDILTISAENLPQNAVFTDGGDNTALFSWRVSDNQAGTFNNILFTVRDPSGNTDSEAISITVGNQVNSILKPELVGVHPRLFFTKDDIAGFKERARTTHKRFIDNCVSEGGRYGDHPPISEINTDDTQALRYAWWILPQAAFAYLFSEASNKEELGQKARTYVLDFVAAPEWQSGSEANIGMGAANILSGVAMAYDCIYDLFTPEERVLIREKIAHQVVLLYENGFLMNQNSTHYWQNDHSNNHMHHRICGLILGALVICDEVDGMEYYAEKALEECRKVAQTISPDGSSHESPTYWLFGTTYVVPAFYALMHATGNDMFNETPFFKNALYYRAHMLAPGQMENFDYGDGGTAPYYFANFLFYLASRYQDGHMQSLYDHTIDVSPGQFIYNAWNFLWYDAELERKPVEELVTWRYFYDMEIASFRSGWNTEDTGILFKCGPYGGHRANEMRNGRYLNVAHDRPDANSFVIYSNGQFLITHGNYAEYQNRYTADHNTILVNGNGQAGECDGWSQPFSNMENMGNITEFFGTPGYSLTTGEAGEYYADLNSYKRDIVFVNNKYYVVHDKILADTPVSIDWMFHGPQQWETISQNKWKISEENASLDLTFFPETAITTALADKKDGERKVLLITTTNNVSETGCMALFNPEPDNETVQKIENSSLEGLEINGSYRDLVIFSKTRPMIIEEFEVNAEKAVLTLNNANDPITIFLIKATGIKQNNESIISFSEAVNARIDINGNDYYISIAKSLGETIDAAQVEVALSVPRADEEYNVTVNGELYVLRSTSEGIIEINIDADKLENPADDSITVIDTRTETHDDNAGSQDSTNDDGGDNQQDTDIVDEDDNSVIPEKKKLTVLNNIFQYGKSDNIKIVCEINEPGHLKITIYDSNGKQIHVVVNQDVAPRTHVFTWDGKSSGNPAGSGIYLVHMKVGSFTETKKIAIIK